MRDFFGLKMGEIPADFIEKWKAYFLNFQKVNWIALSIAVGTVLISLNFNKISGSIVAILLSTVAVCFF